MVIKMKKAISFIHAADLHLDSPFKGLSHMPEEVFVELRNSTFKALDKLIEIAIKKQVDFVLLVGDLFDNDKQSLKAQIHLKEAFEKLESNNIQVYLSYGNHDHINGNIHPIVYPENVQTFSNEAVTSFTYEKAGSILAEIYGFSYENKAVMKDKSEEYPTILDDNLFSIAMLHGTLNGDKTHDPYAPFSLTTLQDKSYDYWALGHIHKREILAADPPIVYAGNTQGRHRNEAGPKGCYYIEMSPNNTEITFIETQSITFESVAIDLAACETRADVEGLLGEVFQGNLSKKLFYITFSSPNQTWVAFDSDGQFTELIDVFNERLLMAVEWGYIYGYKLVVKDLPRIDYEDFFLGELMKTMDDLSIEDVVEELYTHRTARKFLDELPAEEIRQQAKQHLLHELLRVEGSDK